MRRRDRHFGQMAAEIGGTCLFMRWIGVGVQETDGDGLDPVTAAACDDGIEVLVPQGLQHPPVAVDALPYFKPPASRDKRARFLEPHVVQVGTIPPSDL